MTEQLRFGDESVEISVSRNGDQAAVVKLGETSYELHDVSLADGMLSFTLNGRRCRYSVMSGGATVDVTDGKVYHRFQRVEAGLEVEEDSGSGQLSSQMPGVVLRLLHNPGDSVSKGQALLILEAMKMEHEVCAPADGTVNGYPFNEGDRVMPGDLLVDFMSAEDAAE